MKGDFFWVSSASGSKAIPVRSLKIQIAKKAITDITVKYALTK